MRWNIFIPAVKREKLKFKLEVTLLRSHNSARDDVAEIPVLQGAAIQCFSGVSDIA